jgi:hypothetical protein
MSPSHEAVLPDLPPANVEAMTVAVREILISLVACPANVAKMWLVSW